MDAKKIVQLIKHAVDIFPTKGFGIWVGDKNHNGKVDVTVTLEMDSGKRYPFGPFDIPGSDLGSLTDGVAGLLG